jgi:hypothetical protein
MASRRWNLRTVSKRKTRRSGVSGMLTSVIAGHIMPERAEESGGRVLSALGSRLEMAGREYVRSHVGRWVSRRRARVGKRSGNGKQLGESRCCAGARWIPSVPEGRAKVDFGAATPEKRTRGPSRLGNQAPKQNERCIRIDGDDVVGTRRKREKVGSKVVSFQGLVGKLR